MKSWISSEHIQKQKFWLICCMDLLFSIKLIVNLVKLNVNLSGKVLAVIVILVTHQGQVILWLKVVSVDAPMKMFSTTNGIKHLRPARLFKNVHTTQKSKKIKFTINCWMSCKKLNPKLPPVYKNWFNLIK